MSGHADKAQEAADSVRLLTRGEEETISVGRMIGEAFVGGELVGLSGQLGAGKTCLVRGLADGLGIDPDAVRSPSFSLVLPYGGGRLPLYHIDLFRLRPGRIDCMALREYFYGDGVCAVEWFEHLAEPLCEFLEIRLTFVEAQTRTLVAVAHGLRYKRILDLLLHWSPA